MTPTTLDRIIFWRANSTAELTVLLYMFSSWYSERLHICWSYLHNSSAQCKCVQPKSKLIHLKCGLHTLIHTSPLETKLQYLGFNQKVQTAHFRRVSYLAEQDSLISPRMLPWFFLYLLHLMRAKIDEGDHAHDESDGPCHLDSSVSHILTRSNNYRFCDGKRNETQ